MNYQDIKKKSEKELKGILSESRAQLYDLHLKKNVSQIKDVRSMRNLKRAIARIQTRLAEMANEAQVNAKN